MDVNKKIEELRFQRGWSMYELAQQAGITQSTLSSMIKRGNAPKIDTLYFICEAFGITLAQFFMDDEKLEFLNADEKLLITSFRKLPEEKQQALLKLMEK